MIDSFQLANTPGIIFGPGSMKSLPETILSYGRRILLVTGEKSFINSHHWQETKSALKDSGIEYEISNVAGEPSPETVDAIVEKYREWIIDAVVAVGGGSVVDAGKAVSAMLRHKGPVEGYLEGVGDPSRLTGDKIPFIAVPTTSGTGSEATKNAVLSRVGENGFKKSLRHDNFVPDVAIVDPRLVMSCPPGVTAACGMDAFSQLLESYISTKSNPLTDALATSGMMHVKDSLLPSFRDGATNEQARTGMAYASLLSGITLAGAGLAAVHGIAGPIGGLFDIPHGIACGKLLAPCMEKTVKKLIAQDNNNPALNKIATAGNILSGDNDSDSRRACVRLVEIIQKWTNDLELPGLSKFGITEKEIPVIVSRSDSKYNPIELSPDEMASIIKQSL